MSNGVQPPLKPAYTVIVSEDFQDEDESVRLNTYSFDDYRKMHIFIQTVGERYPKLLIETLAHGIGWDVDDALEDLAVIAPKKDEEEDYEG
jgi:hypothetical protein